MAPYPPPVAQDPVPPSDADIIQGVAVDEEGGVIKLKGGAASTLDQPTAGDTMLAIFDCDGVLVDSEVLAVKCEEEALHRAGIPACFAYIVDNYVGLSYDEVAKRIETDFGEVPPPGFFDNVQRAALARFREHLKPVQGLPGLLDELHCPRCVASSSALSRVRLSLDVTGLSRHFKPDHVFSAEMVSKGKPAPDLFLYAAQQLDTDPSQCIVIEDSPHGVAAAVAAGMKCIGFVAGSHCSAALPSRLKAAGAHSIARDASQILISLGAT